MKSRVADRSAEFLKSPPSRGAWIEIDVQFVPPFISSASPPSRGAWIEIRSNQQAALMQQSPPSRGAWIEILSAIAAEVVPVVAPLAGGVD